MDGRSSTTAQVSWLQRFSILAREYHSQSDTKGQYQIKGKATWEGINEADCIEFLRKWSSDTKSTYWYPKYGQFPCINCVAKCQQITTDRQGRKNTEDVLAYIQIAVGSRHSLDTQQLQNVDKIFSTVDHPVRVYITILPEEGLAKKFTLTGNLDHPVVPLHVAYLLLHE
jgi:hypothetical protein